MHPASRAGLFLCAATIILSGCATAPQPDPALMHLTLVDTQLSAQEAEIRRLTETIKDLESKLTKQKKEKAPPGPGGVPLTRLEPDAPESEEVPITVDDAWEETVSDSDPTPMREENIVADSRGEALNHYYRGMHYFDEKRFEKAQVEFRRFLAAEPKHVYADRAMAMEMDCHFESHDYNLAVYASNQLEARYPYSLRLPEALQKRALAYLEMGQSNKATQTLRDLLRRYPDAQVADTASRLLASLDLQKHAAPDHDVWEGHGRGNR